MIQISGFRIETFLLSILNPKPIIRQKQPQEVFFKKGVLRILQNSQEDTRAFGLDHRYSLSIFV